ncbi:DIS3-like exonuclease [Novymonas esmeraldas]|uniref:DIS3-like exonuclease n=1 Tax=Novymonas esmeraldas TaxID=1808958 RepID=A0AAW0F732_9TRYP
MSTITFAYTLGSDPQLESRVRAGDVVIGRVHVFRNFSTNLCFVRSRRFPCDVVVNSAELRGAALHSDVVAVELLPVAQWQPAAKNTAAVGPRDGGDVEDDEKSAAETPAAMPSTLPDGRRIVQLIAPETAVEVAQHAPAEVAIATQIGAPAEYAWPSETRPIGRVVRLMQRSLPRLHVARIAENQVRPGEALQSDYYYRFRPFNLLYPQLAVQGRNIAPAYQASINSSLFSLELQQSETGLLLSAPRMPTVLLSTVGSFLGDSTSAAAATHAICTSCEVASEPFSAEAEACVPASCEIPSAAELAQSGRRDLRESEFVCTIDPATARDLDDALSIAPRADGGFHVGVHIADVSHFVQPGTALDDEARRRSTSTYLVDRVIPMLPSRLSEHYCSLNPGEDKFAFSALFEFDRHGHLISEAEKGEKCEWFGQSVIRSRCRLAYEQAQQILNDDDTVELDVARAAADLGISEEAARGKVKKSVKNLFRLASKLREQSIANGRLVVGNTRLAFHFDRNVVNSPPTSFFVQEQIQANWLVEEFMLLANQRVAQKIVQFIPNGAVLRRHKPPDSQKMRRLRAALEQRHLPFSGSSGQELQRALDRIKADHRDDFYTVCELLKYSLMAAEYIANDPTLNDIRSHFAVAAPWYTHFTSPIRRYCDLMAHRQLRVALELQRCMEEAAVEMPAAPDPAVDARPGDGLFDPAHVVDVDSLQTRAFFYPQSEVESIVTHANSCRLNARNAGNMSLEYFLCLYLLALQKRAREEPSLPQRLCTVATVVRMTEGSALLYSAELASGVEMGLSDARQRFTFRGMLVTGEGAAGTSGAAAEARGAGGAKEQPTAVKAKARARKKGGKSELQQLESNSKGAPSAVKQNGRPRRPDAPLTTAAHISWGPHPETGVEATEVLGLFSEFVALLEVTSKQGRLSLDMLLLPPWERAAARAACPKVPTTLVEKD